MHFQPGGKLPAAAFSAGGGTVYYLDFARDAPDLPSPARVGRPTPAEDRGSGAGSEEL